MPKIALLIAAPLLLGFMQPAAAEPVDHGQELSAQARPHITIYPRQTSPGRNSKRQCRFWLAKEYRVSGTVVVPRQQCWWD